MIIHKSISAIVTVFLMVLAPSSFASSQDSQETTVYQGTEALLFTPWSVFTKSLQSFARPQKTFQQNLTDDTWKIGQFNWRLSGAQWKIVSDFDSSSPSNTQFALQSKSLAITAHVQQASIDQIIDQVVDGVIFHIHVKASCGPIDLSQSTAQVQARLSYQFGPQNISTHMDQFNLLWAPSSWSISPFTCVGPSGIDQAIQQQLAAQLQTADGIQPWIQNLVSNYIQTEVNSDIDLLRAPKTLPLPAGSAPVQLTFANFETNDQGVLTHAQLIWDTKKVNPKFRPLTLTAIPASVSMQNASLFLPQDGISDLLNAQLQARPLWTKVNLNNQDSFEKILDSRFLQFFVWPDLFNYSKSDPFFLSVQKPAALNLHWQKNGSAQTSIKTKAWIQAQRDGSWWNYVLLSGTASGQLSPKIQQGKFKLTVQMNTSDFAAQFGETYMAHYNPNTWIATSVIQDFINNMGQNYQYSFQLPSLDLGALGKAQASSWKGVGQGLINIPFQIIDPAAADNQN